MTAPDLLAIAGRLVELAVAQEQALDAADASAWASLAAEREALYERLLDQLRARPRLDQAGRQALHAIVQADARLASALQTALATTRHTMAWLGRDRLALQGYAGIARAPGSRFVDQTI